MCHIPQKIVYILGVAGPLLATAAIIASNVTSVSFHNWNRDGNSQGVN
jgi:hypothetical protein